MYTDADRAYMARALELAENGRFHVRPNPMVGAVIVKDGRIIGEGYHACFGGPHAEVNAFASCTEDPAGADLYVTLEPCSHYGKTPPCADLIIKKRIRRVVAAMADPNPLVSGRGIRKLKEAGILVETGVMEKECRKFNEVFIKYITERLPFVIYKAALTADGKTASVSGKSQWISCEASRRAAHRMRGCCAAVMTGIGTVLADDPRLTARTEGMPDPIRIIADSGLNTPETACLFREPGKTILLASADAPEEKRERLTAAGAEIIETASCEGKVDLKEAMRKLAQRGIDSILLEGGSRLAAGALRAGIIDKVCFYIAPVFLGGEGAAGPFGGPGIREIGNAVRLSSVSCSRLGTDLRYTAYVENGGSHVYRNC